LTLFFRKLLPKLISSNRPQAAGVRYPAINAFVRTFQQSDDARVRRACVQTAASIFELADPGTALSFVQV
jgi:hypothetical protein